MPHLPNRLVAIICKTLCHTLEECKRIQNTDAINRLVGRSKVANILGLVGPRSASHCHRQYVNR
jgi:hypothetical protein